MKAVWNEVPVLQAVAYEGRGGHGGSRPILLRLEDGRVAHVKLQHNPQSTRSLASDWIGTLLGLGLGAPFPKVILVHLPWEHLPRIPQLVRIRWRPGLQFATEYIPAARPVSPRIDWNTVTNWQDLPLIALVESWLHNQDVKFSHLLVTGEDARALRLVATDHGFILPGGPGWTVEGLRWRRYHFPGVGPISQLAMSLPLRFDFRAAVSACTAVTDRELGELVDSTPKEWELSTRRRRALVDFLRHRRDRLAGVARHLEDLWNHGKPPTAAVAGGG